MKKSLKIISISNLLLSIIGLFIANYSENFRGQQPLYGTLKMIALGMVLGSVLWSLINTLFIYFENKSTLKQNIVWLVLSAITCVFFSLVVIFSLISTLL